MFSRVLFNCLVLCTTLCLSHSKPLVCPYHSKNVVDAVQLLESNKPCSFLSISFSPTNEEVQLIANSLRSTQSVKSFYLSPAFVLQSDEDDRVGTLLRAIQDNLSNPINTLGLWHEIHSDCTDKSATLLVSSLVSLLKKDTDSRISSISIQNQPMATMNLKMLSFMMISHAGIKSLALKVTEDQSEQRDHALASVFQNIGRHVTQMKSLTIEPHHILGSIGVGKHSAASLAASLITNPGTLVNLELRGLKSWRDKQLSSIFNSIHDAGRSVLSRLVLTNTTLAYGSGRAMESLYKLLRLDNGVLREVVLDDAQISYDGARRLSQGFWRTKTLRVLSLLNAPISTDGAAILLDAMTQSRLESLQLRNPGVRLMENYKHVEHLPGIDAKLLERIDKLGKEHLKYRLELESTPEL